MPTPRQRAAEEAKKDALKRANEKQEMFDEAAAVMKAQRKAAEAKENERKRKQKKKKQEAEAERKQNEMKEALARANLGIVRLAMLCFTGGGEPTPNLRTFNPDDRNNTGFEDSLDALIECHNRDKQLFTRVCRLEKWIKGYLELREDCTYSDRELTSTFNYYFTPKVKAQIIAPVEAGSLNDLFNQGAKYKKRSMY